jgi:hypothetical protein
MVQLICPRHPTAIYQIRTLPLPHRFQPLLPPKTTHIYRHMPFPRTGKPRRLRLKQVNVMRPFEHHLLPLNHHLPRNNHHIPRRPDPLRHHHRVSHPHPLHPLPQPLHRPEGRLPLQLRSRGYHSPPSSRYGLKPTPLRRSNAAPARNASACRASTMLYFGGNFGFRNSSTSSAVGGRSTSSTRRKTQPWIPLPTQQQVRIEANATPPQQRHPSPKRQRLPRQHRAVLRWGLQKLLDLFRRRRTSTSSTRRKTAISNGSGEAADFAEAPASCLDSRQPPATGPAHASPPPAWQPPAATPTPDTTNDGRQKTSPQPCLGKGLRMLQAYRTFFSRQPCVRVLT